MKKESEKAVAAASLASDKNRNDDILSSLLPDVRACFKEDDQHAWYETHCSEGSGGSRGGEGGGGSSESANVSVDDGNIAGDSVAVDDTDAAIDVEEDAVVREEL